MKIFRKGKKRVVKIKVTLKHGDNPDITDEILLGEGETYHIDFNGLRIKMAGVKDGRLVRFYNFRAGYTEVLEFIYEE